MRDVDILVIANAGTDAESSWELPTPSAFTDDEIDVVVRWVADGGALFLIADHMPAAGAAVLSGGGAPTDSFFDSVTHIGGMNAGDDWTSWTTFEAN